MTTYICPYCSNKFNSKKKMLRHIELQHREAEKQTQPPLSKETPPPEHRESKEESGSEYEKTFSKTVREELEKLLPEFLEKYSGKETVTERELKYEGGVAITKKVKLDPDVIKLYHYVLAHAESEEDKITFDEFINKVVLEYFSDYLGIEPAIIRKKVRKK